MITFIIRVKRSDQPPQTTEYGNSKPMINLKITINELVNAVNYFRIIDCTHNAAKQDEDMQVTDRPPKQ